MKSTWIATTGGTGKTDLASRDGLTASAGEGFW